MNTTYYTAAFWFLAHIFVGVINDVLAKHLGSTIPVFEIVFLRFSFSTILLIPFLYKNRLFNIKSKLLNVHILRALLLFIGISTWCICLNNVPIVIVTLMGFTIPIFFILLAYFFLNENIDFNRAIVTILGFVGVFITINPTHINFNPLSFLLIVGALSFAGLDVINKKIISRENTINMMFFSSFFTAIFSAIVVQIIGWVAPKILDILLCFILGIGANLILYTLLKAFSLADATSLIPIRYFEIILSGGLGYFLFHEIPSSTFYVGAFIILSCNTYLIYNENKKKF